MNEGGKAENGRQGQKEMMAVVKKKKHSKKLVLHLKFFSIR